MWLDARDIDLIIDAFCRWIDFGVLRLVVALAVTTEREGFIRW